MVKYALIELDNNLKPKKIVSFHKNLSLAKKKMQTYKMSKSSKGLDIVKVS